MYYIVEFTVFDRTGAMDGMSMSTVVKANSIVQAEHLIDTYWYNIAKMISIDSVKEYHLLTNDEIQLEVSDMMFDTLSEVSDRIVKHHSHFAGAPVSETNSVLDKLCEYISSTPCVGATFTAVATVPDTDITINTYITINNIDGRWEFKETPADWDRRF